ncbi:hypothetical protein OQA88_7212 [Cercophora sp. LCS_1]
MTLRAIDKPHSATAPAVPTADTEQPTTHHIIPTNFGIAIRPKSPISPPENSTTVIKATLLIPGAEPPIPNAALVITDNLITWVGKQSDLPALYTSQPHRAITVPYLMPGLWDTHVHFGGMSTDPDDYPAIVAGHPATAGARLAKGCWEALQRGYTSLRDLAGYGCELSKAVADGTIIGPTIYSAGACLSQTGGHGDTFAQPAGDVLLNAGVSPVKPGHFGGGEVMLVDGADECRRAVRLQIRRGAKVIKVFASGGVLSRDDGPLNAQFSEEELACIVKEAKRQGRIVAAHVHGKPGILAALEAGVGSVEHMSMADEECIQLVKEKGVVYVATRTVVEMLLKSKGEGLPKKVWEKVQLVSGSHQKAYKLAIEAGAKIALGSDTAPGFNMAVELEYAVECGMTSLEAIRAATANGPLTLGPQAPLTGQLKEGYEADIIAVAGNPVENIKVLQKNANITWVWKGGKVFKGPGVGPWGEGYRLNDDV